MTVLRMAIINMNRSLEAGEGGMREGRRDGKLGENVYHILSKQLKWEGKKKNLKKQAFFIKLVIFFFSAVNMHAKPRTLPQSYEFSVPNPHGSKILYISKE